MWSSQLSLLVNATREEIWRQWADMPNWGRWDEAVARSYLNGGFKDGIGCMLKWRRIPLLPGVLRDCQPPETFTIEGGFPLVNLRLRHEMVETGGGVKITRRLEVSGPLGFLFRRTMKRRIIDGFPQATARLVG